MRTLVLVPLVVLVLVALWQPSASRFTPDWKSLDSRPLPQWYDEAKIGIFVHWGVFSVPSFRSEWFWWYWKGEPQKEVVDFMRKQYPPGFTYADFAPQFSAAFFDAGRWAELFAASGAKYVVLTSKHHEGFCNWDTAYSFNWNSVQVGPGRDLVSELAAATRGRGLRFGLYHSLFEWFHPLYLADKGSNFTQRSFVAAKTMPELYELVQKYRPDVVWSDGDGDAPAEYWNSTQFLAWLYNDSPVRDSVVTNDRWGRGTLCQHGGYLTCSDRFQPGHLLARKWENAMTLDSRSWGFRREASLADYLSIQQLLQSLATTVSCGGNLLLNVGPTKDGTIVPLMEERLRQLGAWLRVNGDAVYGSSPWRYQNDTRTPGVWYTQRAQAVYAMLLQWPVGQLRLGAVAKATEVSLLGATGSLTFSTSPQGIVVQLPPLRNESLQWAWTLRILGAEPRAVAALPPDVL